MGVKDNVDKADEVRTKTKLERIEFKKPYSNLSEAFPYQVQKSHYHLYFSYQFL